MIKVVLTFIFCFSPLWAFPPNVETSILAFDEDLLVHLEDGSVWQVHPKERKKVRKWEVNERAHIEMRSRTQPKGEDYCFRLCNDAREDAAKVMLLSYGENGRHSVDRSAVYVYNTRPDWSYGPWFERWYISGVIYDEAMDVTLDEGISCSVIDHFRAFAPGTPVYLGCNQEEQRDRYFLISGIEGDAVYSWLIDIKVL